MIATMRRQTWWTLAGLAVLAALVVGLSVELTRGPPGAREDRPAQADRTQPGAEDPVVLADLRQRAALPPCPAPAGGPGPEALRGVTVECAADGSPVEVAPALAGRVAVLNLWAYWCGPCAEELPAMADYQGRVGGAVTVVTVHQDQNEAAALARMADLKVRLPVLQDGGRTIAAALTVPNVMPATVVLRRDGSVAKVLPQAFTSADEIADAVDSALR